jgi:hypothetical protein
MDGGTSSTLMATKDMAVPFPLWNVRRAMTLDLNFVEATRCLVAFRSTQDYLQLVSLPCWSDGEALWLAPPGVTPVVEALRHLPNCAVEIGEATGLVATAHARVFGADDPLGLVMHGPVIALALATLAIRHPRQVVRPWLPLRLPVVVRLALGELQTAERFPSGPGIAPALPEVVPADVRRHLSGLRDVVVAGEHAVGLRIGHATWSAGFVLHGDLPASPGTPIAVAVQAGAVGVVLSGELDARNALRPTQVSWWSGLYSGTAPLPPPPRGAVTLPD